MYRFTKIKDENNEFDKTNVSVTIPFNDVDLNDLFEAFTDFLKGCSFFIAGKHIELVDDDSNDKQITEDLI